MTNKLFNLLIIAAVFIFGLSACKETSEIAPSQTPIQKHNIALPLEGLKVKQYAAANGRAEGDVKLIAFESVTAFANTVKLLTAPVQNA